MSKRKNTTIYANDATEKVSLLLRLRLPWLAIGLLFGSITTLIVARFETLLATEVRLAFFIPIIVYLSDAVGTQTETIYVRNLAKRQTRFSIYLVKELTIGLILGVIFGLAMALFAFIWLRSEEVAATVGIAMFASIASATVIALIVPTILRNRHQDPALGSGPFTTVIQDLVSLLIYFLVATALILR